MQGKSFILWLNLMNEKIMQCDDYKVQELKSI